MARVLADDFNIGAALWFAARGHGKVLERPAIARAIAFEGKNNNNNAEFNPAHAELPQETSAGRVVFSGIGADEPFAGYGRHRTAWRRGLDDLRRELSKDIFRLHARNHGRDDRVISDHGREPRFPFLDHDFLRAVSALPCAALADLSLPRGEGEKLLLRSIAKRMGLDKVALFPKRAIQFRLPRCEACRREDPTSEKT